MQDHGKKSKIIQFKGTLEMLSSLFHPAVSLQEGIPEKEKFTLGVSGGISIFLTLFRKTLYIQESFEYSCISYLDLTIATICFIICMLLLLQNYESYRQHDLFLLKKVLNISPYIS